MKTFIPHLSLLEYELISNISSKFTLIRPKGNNINILTYCDLVVCIKLAIELIVL